MPEELNQTTQAMDALMRQAFKENEPGATVLVAKNGKPIFRQGYGLANLELGVHNEPHMVFRLGSITKQFTAVAILILHEQGKLDPQDEITKFLPDYPTHGHRITVEHLLLHTSGIKSYTNMQEWMGLMRKDLTLDELIGVFKFQPMEFAPGERWNYNNSGYVLLGAIIEKVSGQTYAEFLKQNIFEPLGMKDTYFDMPNPIIPGRVSGYKPAGDHYENADYLSMTQPHAAGSLASSVDDMLRWDEALYTEKLLKQETLQKAWTSGKLNSGLETGYGYGWSIAEVQGIRVITHAGGVNGFITDGVRLPDDHVYAIVLTNAGKPFSGLLAYKLAALAAGKPYQEPVSVNVAPEILQRYAAMYEIPAFSVEVPVEFREGQLHARIPLEPGTEILPLSETEFFYKDSAYRVTFKLDEAGAVTGFTLTGLYGRKMEGVRTDKPLPSQRAVVDLPPAALERLAGEYQVAPGIVFTVTLEDGLLFATAPGQPRMQLHAASETEFFLKEAPVSMLFQKDASGKVMALVVRQGGRDLNAPKIK